MDEESNGFDPTVKSASNHANIADHTSLRSKRSCSNEDSPTQALLGEMTDDATDLLKCTKNVLSLKNTSKMIHAKHKRGSDIFAT